MLDGLPAPKSRLHDPLEEVLLVAPLDRAVFRQFGKPYHGGEDVIEIMGDAAGKRAQGLHFVRLPQLLLKAPCLRDIEIDLEDCEGISFVIPLQGLTAEYGDLAPCFCRMDQFSLPAAFFGQ